MKEKALNAATIVLVVCALVVTGLVVNKTLFASSDSGEKDAPLQTKSVEFLSEVKTSQFTIGDADAEVTITTFFDYQCPYCKKVETSLQRLRDEFGSEVRLVYRHRPLPGHEQAVPAAIAAACANESEHFAEYHELLFKNSDSLSEAKLDRLAAKAGIEDVAAFRECRKSEAAHNVIRSHVSLAREEGVDSVPAVVVGDRLVEGAQPYSVLRDLVKEELHMSS